MIVFTGAIGFFACGLLAALAAPRGLLRLVYLLFAAGASLAVAALAGAWPSPAGIRLPLSGSLSFHFAYTGLGGFFALVLSLLAVPVCIYSVGYTAHAARPRIKALTFGAFLLTMYGVFFAADVLTFVVLWEAMSLVSYFLVTERIEDEAAQRTGLLYALMTHAGTGAIVASFLLMAAAAGSLEFTAIREAMSGRSDAFSSLVFLLALAGFGTKAGVVPLHVWLPEAHPAAPSNVSALMSGVMIKSGVYGILLVGIGLLGAPLPWWGAVVLGLGALSSVLGVLYALMEHNLKRLLAYHSVENVGIILLGTGAGMIFNAHGMSTLAALALAAALYHTLNHALFKGLLFLGAGSLQHALGTLNVEKMGGLVRRMPWTAACFLAGSVAICALPPFNGFVSEWLTFQSLVLGIKVPAPLYEALLLTSGAALALTGALAAACFVKAFGISFLGSPRSPEASAAGESSLPMRAGMVIPAALCLVFGVFPGTVMGRIAAAGGGEGTLSVLRLSGSFSSSPAGVVLRTPEGFSALSAPVVAMALTVIGVGSFLLLRLVYGRTHVTPGAVWDCGLGHTTPRMQYTATSFTKPIRVIFDRLYRPRREISVRYRIRPLFVEGIAYRSEISQVFERWMYRPLVSAVNRLARLIQPLQSGSLHLYLGYILGTLVVLLLFWS